MPVTKSMLANNLIVSPPLAAANAASKLSYLVSPTNATSLLIISVSLASSGFVISVFVSTLVFTSTLAPSSVKLKPKDKAGTTNFLFALSYLAPFVTDPSSTFPSYGTSTVFISPSTKKICRLSSIFSISFSDVTAVTLVPETLYHVAPL